MNARSLVVALLASYLFGCISLECPAAEVDYVKACTQVVDAFSRTLSGCQLDTSMASSVCQSNCYYSCEPQTDVQACASAIEALGCEQASVESVLQLASCKGLLEAIKVEQCSSGGGDGDWDD